MKRVLSILICFALLVGTITACGGAKQSADNTSSPAPAQSAAPTETPKVYPIPGNVTLEVWAKTQATTLLASNADTVWAPELEKRTGVKIEWLHNTTTEQFNLMVASGDYPDIIFNDWLYSYKGGTAKAIAEGLIIPLNDVIDKYAPNLKKYFEENPEVAKRARDDNGQYGVFPTIRKEEDLRTYIGPIVRKDWLDDLGLSIPETIDDWHEMLTQFKNKKNSTAPFTMEKGIPFRNAGMIGSWGLYYGMFMVDGKVKYGPAEPEYKDFLTTMNQWYKEGILDPDIAAMSSKVLTSKMTDGTTGATFGLLGGGIGTWTTLGKEKNPKYQLVGVPYPVLKKGDTPKISAVSGFFGPYQAAISTQCKDVEVAAKWLDYAYSEEGHMFYNFGIEGVSYNMVNGVPTYTDLIMKAPEGTREILGKYTYTNGAKIDDLRAYLQYSVNMPEQEAALKAWKTDSDKYLLPELQPTVEETDEITSLMGDIEKYTKDMYFKFILGEESLERFDDYIAQLKKMGLDRAIELYQAALDRYNKR